MEYELNDILTVEELMKLLNIGKNTAYSLLDSGEIKAFRIAQYYGNYQCVYSVHEKAVYYNGKVKSLYHVHFILNSVSFIDGRMFSQSKGEIGQFKKYIEQVTRDKHFKMVYGSDDRD